MLGVLIEPFLAIHIAPKLSGPGKLGALNSIVFHALAKQFTL